MKVHGRRARLTHGGCCLQLRLNLPEDVAGKYKNLPQSLLDKVKPKMTGSLLSSLLSLFFSLLSSLLSSLRSSLMFSLQSSLLFSRLSSLV